MGTSRKERASRQSSAVQRSEPDAPVLLAQNETDALAREMANAYRRMAAFYRDQMKFTGPSADKCARGTDNLEQEAAEDRQRILERPFDQVTWWDLVRLAEQNPGDAQVVWIRIREEAQCELASGHRTAQVLEWRGEPFQRARFLAIRDSFRGSTPLQNGIEAALIDTAAEAFGDYLEWSEHFHMQVSSEVESERHQLEHEGGWNPPRLSMADAIEQSSRMAERAYTRFLRTIKMVHELRRTSSSIYVGSAGQINLGQQQVNVAASPSPPNTVGQDLPKS